jgi:hypothetical protein
MAEDLRGKLTDALQAIPVMRDVLANDTPGGVLDTILAVIKGATTAGVRHNPPDWTDSTPICGTEQPFGEHNEDTHVCWLIPSHVDVDLDHYCSCRYGWPAAVQRHDEAAGQ